MAVITRALIAGLTGLAGLVLVASAGWSRDGRVLQSFGDALETCVGLLQIGEARVAEYRAGIFRADADTQCVIRCVGLVARFWDDRTGLRPDILGGLFRPDAADRGFDDRTVACLHQVPSQCAGHKDVCGRAYWTFMCYYHQYGNLVHDRVFVPLDNLQLLHVTAQCLAVLQISVENLVNLSMHELEGDGEVQCLVRCIGIESGVYSDRTGPNIDRIYAQYGAPHNATHYKAKGLQCFDRYRADQQHNKCLHAYNTLYRCFEDVRNVITEYEYHDRR